MDAVRSLVESIVRQVILEYGGVSDETVNMSRLIFNMIRKQHLNYDFVKLDDNMSYNGHSLYGKGFLLDFSHSSELMSIANSIDVVLYFYYNERVFNEDYFGLTEFLRDKGLQEMSFSPKDRRITLTFAWPSTNTLDANAENDVISSINHEVKHAYQNSKRNDGMRVSDQYLKARAERRKGFDDNYNADTALKHLVDYTIPWLYYKLDKDEIDAWIQELYIQGNNTNDIKKTTMYKKLIETINDYEKLKDWYTSSDAYYTNQGIKEYIDSSIRRIDNPKSYFNLCEKNVQYLRNKMRRVIGRWYEEQGNSSGSFKKYSSNEIQQASPFVQKQDSNKHSRLRNVFNRFLGRKQ